MNKETIDNWQQEYETREFIWVTHVYGGVPYHPNFHPMYFKGTEKQHDEILHELFGKYWDNGFSKVTGREKFANTEEYNQKYSIKKLKVTYEH